METILTRFGEVEYDPEHILYFPSGLIGFPNLRRFVVMPNKKEGPLFWIQNIDDPDFAFVLTDPTNFFLNYTVKADSAERLHLNIEENDSIYVLTIVTVPPDQKITINLAAPILFSPKTNRAIQIILDNNKYQSKTPLPTLEPQK